MRVDLNADVGEYAGPLTQEPALIPLVTSVNIACGFHAGDPHTMRRTAELALANGVAIGAHPGLPDRSGFGRREMRLVPADIEEIVACQVGALAAIAALCGARVAHVKPHGALYNMAADDPALAAAIARAVAAVDGELILVGLSGSRLLAAGRTAGLRVAAEVFADRGYQPDGRLLPRSVEGAVLEDGDQIAARAVRMVRERRVAAQGGRDVALEVDTICIHGDTPGAPVLAARVRDALTAAGVTLTSMAGQR